MEHTKKQYKHTDLPYPKPVLPPVIMIVWSLVINCLDGIEKCVIQDFDIRLRSRYVLAAVRTLPIAIAVDVMVYYRRFNQREWVGDLNSSGHSNRRADISHCPVRDIPPLSSNTTSLPNVQPHDIEIYIRSSMDIRINAFNI